MKRVRFLMIVLGAVCLLAGSVALSMLSTVQADQSVSQQNTVIVGFDAVSGSRDTEFVLNENGYQYRTIQNADSRLGTDNGKSARNQGIDKGKDEEAAEVPLSWEDAQDYLEEYKLNWLCNEYLYAGAEDIVISVSGEDIMTAAYLMQESKVTVSLFVVAQEESESFLFGRSYPSALYNIRQVEEGYTWQCFSYRGYDGLEHTSAVLGDGNSVCEISFENCEEAFICETLGSYKK